MSAATLLVGGRRTERGRAVPFERSLDALAHQFLRLRDEGKSWVIVGEFAGQGRSAADWRGADGVLIDLDFSDPRRPEADPRPPLPADIRARLVAAARSGTLAPGVYYPTRRGCRYGALFTRRIVDFAEYREAVRAVAERGFVTFCHTGLPLFRDFEPGFFLDEGSLDVTHCQDLPLPGMEVAVCGTQLFDPDDSVQILEPDSHPPTLDIDSALPSNAAPVAKFVQEAGRHSQVPIEVPAAKLMATASALIGNTRRVVDHQGRETNVAIAIVTALESGGGKGDTDGVINRTLDFVFDATRARAQEARRAMDEYEARFEAWTKGRRKDPTLVRPERSAAAHVGAAFVISDSTIEALVDVLQANRDGRLLLDLAEMEVVQTLLGAYKDKRGSQGDKAKVRSILVGERIQGNRKGSGHYDVPRPFLAAHIFTQPGVAARFFDASDQVSGLLARFNVHEVAPLAVRRFLTEQGGLPVGMDARLVEEIRDLFRGLYAMKPDRHDDDGWAIPVIMPLFEDAEIEMRRQWERDDVGALAKPRVYRSLIGHWRGHVKRFAAVIQLLADPDAQHIGMAAVRMALVWKEYFLKSFLAAFAPTLAENERDRVQGLHSWISKRVDEGLPVTTREILRHVSPYRGHREGGRLVGRDMLRLGYRIATPEPGAGRPSEKWVRSTRLRRNGDDANRGGSAGNAHDEAFLDGQRESEARSHDQDVRQNVTKPSRSAPRAPKPSSTHEKTVRQNVTKLGRAASSTSKAGRKLEKADFERVRQQLLAGWSERLEGERRQRIACPICTSSDGLGWNPKRQRWSCFGDKHAADRREGSGCASGDVIDLELGSELGRNPSADERAAFVRQCLHGAGATGRDSHDRE